MYCTTPRMYKNAEDLTLTPHPPFSLRTDSRSSHCPLTLLSRSSHFPLTVLSRSSHSPPTLLSRSSHCPLTLLPLSSHGPLTVLSHSSHFPLTVLSRSSHAPLTVLSCSSHGRLTVRSWSLYYDIPVFKYFWPWQYCALIAATAIPTKWTIFDQVLTGTWLSTECESAFRIILDYMINKAFVEKRKQTYHH